MPKAASKTATLAPALPQSGDDITMTSVTESTAPTKATDKVKSKSLNLVPDIQPPTEAPLTVVVPDSVQRINEKGEVVIDRDYLLQMKKIGFPLPWFIYFAMEIDVACGHQKPRDHKFTDSYITAFCGRWDLPFEDFLAGLKPLLKKGMTEVPNIQMSLSLFELDDLPLND
jgi:hypothetical protein